MHCPKPDAFQSGTAHFKGVADSRVIQVSEAGDLLQQVCLDAAVFDHSGVDVNSYQLADHYAGRSFQGAGGKLYDAPNLAFERRSAGRHAGRAHVDRGSRLEARSFKLVDAIVMYRRCQVHVLALLEAHDVDDELRDFSYISQSVFRGAAIVFGGRREHDHRWIDRDDVEVRIGSEIDLSGRAYGADPGDGTRSHQCGKRVVRQRRRNGGDSGIVEHALRRMKVAVSEDSRPREP